MIVVRRARRRAPTVRARTRRRRRRPATTNRRRRAARRLAAMYASWRSVGCSRWPSRAASQASAEPRSRPRRQKLPFRSARSHSTTSATTSSNDASSPAVIQFSATSSGRRASRSTSARSTGTSRLLCRSAWRISSPHTCDETKDGDTTTTTAFADSIPASIRARQSALFGMSSRSTHRSLPFAASAATSRWTNSPSRRGRRRTRPAAAAAGPPPVTPPASPPPSSSGGSRRSARVSSRQDPELDESTRRRLC